MLNLLKTHIFTKLFISILIILSSSMSNAQDKQPSIKINLFSAENVVIRDIINVDAKFGKKHNIPILTPFTFQVPRQDGVNPLVEFGDKPNSMMIKINFATGDKNTAQEDRQLIENLQFIPFDIEMTDHEDRLVALTNLMVKDAFDMVTRSYEQREYIGARRDKIGDTDIIDAVGKVIEPTLGLMYVRLVGFLNPNDKNGVFAVANIVADKYEITNLDQLFLTGSGQTISSFKYITD